ncbi:hypothetical protein Leryth_010584 [Lithospermum erythrorhizon]|nr:hypothetical protein Leryth_010584 [Lithospermum erythrorhizon]
MATFEKVNGQQLTDSIQSLFLQSQQSEAELKSKSEEKNSEKGEELDVVRAYAYCVTCILRWASYKNEPTCPQCKHPLESLLINRSLDGSLQDYMSEESICLLLRASWFKPLIVEEREEVDDEMEEFYAYEDEDDDLHEAYFGRSSNLRIGNRRWGDNGYVRGGRQEARPRPVQCPNFQDSGAAGSSRQPKKKEVPKEVVGRRAKRAEKREAADKAAAEKHQQRLIRIITITFLRQSSIKLTQLSSCSDALVSYHALDIIQYHIELRKMNLRSLQNTQPDPANKEMASPSISTSSFAEASTETPKRNNTFNIKLLSLPLFVPWAKNKFQMPTTVNKKLKRSYGVDVESRLQYPDIQFRPYVSRVPWHTGTRAFLSQFFPRYGRYCGPNWSSGRDRGSPIWDKRPIDWLDFCCYCHDIGYDSHDQAELLKADLAFLECLERPHMTIKGDAHVARVYKTMCISGLQTILIPYRKHLVKLQTGQLSLQFGWLSDMIWRRWSLSKS